MSDQAFWIIFLMIITAPLIVFGATYIVSHAYFTVKKQYMINLMKDGGVD